MNHIFYFHMKKYWVVAFFLMFSLPGFGQGRDTVLAVHKLFKQRREGGQGWMAAGATSAVEEGVGWRAIRPPAENARASAVNGGVPMAVGLLQYQRFSEEREAEIIKMYNDGWPIPADIRRKLRRKHFHRTSRDVVSTN